MLVKSTILYKTSDVSPQKEQLWACTELPWDDSGFSRALLFL